MHANEKAKNLASRAETDCCTGRAEGEEESCCGRHGGRGERCCHDAGGVSARAREAAGRRRTRNSDEPVDPVGRPGDLWSQRQERSKI